MEVDTFSQAYTAKKVSSLMEFQSFLLSVTISCDFTCDSDINGSSLGFSGTKEK